MKTPRKRITFKTPKKRQTPLLKKTIGRGRTERQKKGPTQTDTPSSSQNQHSDSLKHTPTLDEINTQIEKKEKEGIDVYRAENRYLRMLKSDATLFKKFTGIEILEKDGAYLISQSIVGKDGPKLIKFELREEGDAYIYKLIDTNCTDLPCFLEEDISFENREIHKFFFKVLEVLVAKNTQGHR